MTKAERGRRRSETGDLKPEGEAGNLVSGFKFQIRVSSSASFQDFHQAQANDVVEGNGAFAEQRCEWPAKCRSVAALARLCQMRFHQTDVGCGTVMVTRRSGLAWV